MKIALINGSPKPRESTSAMLLHDIGSYMKDQAELIEINFHHSKVSSEILEQLKTIDVMIVACPLYVDGLPGHLLSCLSQLENQIQDCSIYVYGIVNCGFYEGEQANIALDVLKNWCHKTHLSWAGGIGIGGGGGLSQMPSGPKVPIDKELQLMAKNILQTQTNDNQYVSVVFPRFLYKMSAQFGWRRLIKANGGHSKDLSKRWE